MIYILHFIYEMYINRYKNICRYGYIARSRQIELDIYRKTDRS